MRFVYAKVKQISDIIRQIYKKYRDLANYKHLMRFEWDEFVYWNLYRNAMFACMNRYVLFLLAVGISFLLVWVTSHLIKHSTRFR